MLQDNNNHVSLNDTLQPLVTYINKINKKLKLYAVNTYIYY